MSASFLGDRKHNLLPGSGQIKPLSAVLHSIPFRTSIPPGSPLSAASLLAAKYADSCLLANICRDASGNCILDLHEVLAGGRNNFSSSSEELLTQQTPPLCCSTSTNPPRPSPGLLPSLVAPGQQRTQTVTQLCGEFYLCPRHVSPAEADVPIPCYGIKPCLCPSLLPGRAWCSAVHAPGDSVQTHSLARTQPEQALSPAALLFPLPPKHTCACQQLKHIKNGKESLVFHPIVAQNLPPPKQLPGSSLTGQCSTAETHNILFFLHLDLTAFRGGALLNEVAGQRETLCFTLTFLFFSSFRLLLLANHSLLSL